jgi:hypothetical protein
MNTLFRSFSAIILSLIVTSCTTTPVPVVYNCPAIVLPQLPVAQTSRLKPDATPDKIIKAWVATATEYKAWAISAQKQVQAH